MKLLVASDIHGSAQYLKLLLDRFKDEQADRLVLLGDVLYHGPRNDLPDGYAPKQVIDMLNPLAGRILCVRGNCDTEVDQMVLKFPVLADYAVIVAGDQLIYLTHGHIYNADNLPPVVPGDVVLYGHTHIPEVHTSGGITFANPGSVSIPKADSSRGYILLKDGRLIRKSLNGKTEWDHSIR